MKTTFAALVAFSACLYSSYAAADGPPLRPFNFSVRGPHFSAHVDRQPGGTRTSIHTPFFSLDVGGARHHPVAGPNGWRYRWQDGRWWYWTAKEKWLCWIDDKWVDYKPGMFAQRNGAPAGPKAADAKQDGNVIRGDQVVDLLADYLKEALRDRARDITVRPSPDGRGARINFGQWGEIDVNVGKKK